MGVRHAEPMEFDPMGSILEDHLLRKQNAGCAQRRLRHVPAPLGLILPTTRGASEQGRLVFAHPIEHALVGDDGGSVFKPNLVAVGVIAVVMGVEGEPDGVGRGRLNLGEDLDRTTRKIAIDHEDIVVEDDPTIVAMPLPGAVALMEPDAGCNFLSLVDLRGKTH